MSNRVRTMGLITMEMYPRRSAAISRAKTAWICQLSENDRCCRKGDVQP